jgi:hypothetical protein
MYVLTDKITGQVLGRFENLTEARGTLLDFYRLHPPGGRWLEIAIEHEPRDSEHEPRDFKLLDAA